MPNPFGAPELTVHDIKRKLDGDEYFVWLDVREPTSCSGPPFATIALPLHPSAAWPSFKPMACPKRRKTSRPKSSSSATTACAVRK
jgi:hypothetical protein